MKSPYFALLALLLTVGCSEQRAPVESAPTAESTPAAATAEMIPREIIFGNPDRTVARISPDGAWISWLAPLDGVMNVWVAPADKPEEARAITRDTYRGLRSYRWAPNSQFVYFSQDQGGDENFRVYSAAVETGEVVNLTPIKDGARATIQAVSRARPNHLVVGINERNPQIFDLYLVDVTSGERELLIENPGYAGWVIDSTLTPRFGLKTGPDGGATYVDMEGNEILDIPAEDFLTTSVLGFNAAGDALLMLDSRGRNTAALTRISPSGELLAVIGENDKADVSGVLRDARTREAIAFSANYLKTRWQGLDDETRADIAALEKQLPGYLEILGTTDDMSRWMVYEDTAESAGAYFLYDRATRSVSKVLDTRPELAAKSLAPMQAFTIPARDGLELPSYLTLPVGSDSSGNGKPDAPLPMVLVVHGGPWARDNYGYHAWHQWLANRGYAVLSVNYRGSTGFGKDFTRAAIREFAGKMHDDLIDGVTWAIQNGVADPERIAITGGSYGGYATLIGVSFTPDTFACGVDIVGPSSLATLIESFPDYWKPILAGSWFTYVGDPENPEDRKDMLARSAISRVDAIKVPLLVGQGGNDPRVTKLESDQLVEAMAAKQLPVTYVNFPDEGHGFQRPQNRLAFYAVMEGFLQECLGGAAEPVGSAMEGSSIEILHGGEFIANLGE